MKIPASLPDDEVADDPDESDKDPMGEDCSRESLAARVEQNARDIEYLIEHAEQLTDQLDRALGDGDGVDGEVDTAGDDDRIDTPDDRRAHRGYE